MGSDDICASHQSKEDPPLTVGGGADESYEEIFSSGFSHQGLLDSDHDETIGSSSPAGLDEILSAEADVQPRRSHSRKYVPPEKLTKKRQRQPEKWGKNVIKAEISKGEEYVNSTGKRIRAREVQPPCDVSCRLKCSSKLTDADRRDIHKGFYQKHLTREEKWGFISRHVTSYEKSSNSDNASIRKYSRQ